MAATLKLPLVAFAADGASSELLAQALMDSTSKSSLPHFEYNHNTYGVHLHVPNFPVTGPIVSITDPHHTVKTGRNQP